MHLADHQRLSSRQLCREDLQNDHHPFVPQRKMAMTLDLGRWTPLHAASSRGGASNWFQANDHDGFEVIVNVYFQSKPAVVFVPTLASPMLFLTWKPTPGGKAFAGRAAVRQRCYDGMLQLLKSATSITSDGGCVPTLGVYRT